jgi:hypothetical protein
MTCSRCGGEIPDKCPVCGSDLTNLDNLICGTMVPKYHCLKCWSNK